MSAPDMPPQDSNHTEFTTEATDYALNVLATDLLATDLLATDPLAIDPLAIDPLAIESTPDIAIENDINDPGRDAEIVELEAAIAAIPYSAPSIPLSPELKTRLFERIAQHSSSQVQSELLQLLEQSIEDLKKKAEGLKWQSVPGMKNGTMATYQIDKASRSIAFFVRATTPEEFPNHYHAAGEHILVLKGNFVVGDQVYAEGDRLFSPANTSHQPSTTQGCLVFCVSSIDDKML